ncbi:MAG: hypothetical protein AAFQ98_24410 [Bacteroidota bacterium]
MRTLTVYISEEEFEEAGLERTNLTFSELKDFLNRANARSILKKTALMAEENGLSSMTLDEINEEIRSYRAENKDNS